MKALYFDCSSGISGNMTLGALLELVDDQEWFLDELNKLGVDGYHIHISKDVKNGITGTYVDVHLDHDHEHEHHHHHDEDDHHHDHEHHHHHYEDDHHHHHDEEDDHEHHHDHVHRHLSDIEAIIDNADIDEAAKGLAKRIFLRVAKAESKVHNMPLDEVHFHEVGAVDSIVDIIGTAILITRLAPDMIFSSVVNDGYGFVECAHGLIPVPVPATSEIIASSHVISRQIAINTELVTPTGAAIIAELSSTFGPMPAMDIRRIGWGCGSKNLKIPNVLKVSMGDIEKHPDEIFVCETNIDDCTAEILGYVMEKLMEEGARDVFFTPIFMKKNRPAYRLTFVCDEAQLGQLQDIVFKNSTTIGMRYRKEKRKVLERRQTTVESPYGEIKVKEIHHNGDTYVYPEYESLKDIADKEKIPLKDLYRYFSTII